MNFNVENPANAFFGTVQGLQNLDSNRMQLDQQRQQQVAQQQSAQQQQQIHPERPMPPIAAAAKRKLNQEPKKNDREAQMGVCVYMHVRLNAVMKLDKEWRLLL